MLHTQFCIRDTDFSEYPLIGPWDRSAPRGLISTLYLHLLSAMTNGAPLEVRIKWQQLVPDLSDEDWEEACSAHLSVSPAVNNKLIHLYMLYKTYLTPARLHAMHRIPTSACTRCTCLHADFTHVMWLCPVIVRYWQQVSEILSAVLSVPVPCIPLVCHLGILNEEQWPRHIRTMLLKTLVMARKVVALKWIRPTPPSIHTLHGFG